MSVLVKLGGLFLSFLLLSCNSSEEPDYPAVASTMFNDILVDVVDSDGNTIIGNRDVINELSFIGKDEYKLPFHVIEIGENKLIKTVFPLPLESSMSYSDDRKDGYGESNLTVNVNGSKFRLRGKFHYTCAYPNMEMLGCNGIELIEIYSNDSNISISEDANFLKIIIRIETV